MVQLDDDEEELPQTQQRSMPRCSADNEVLVQQFIQAMQQFFTEMTKAHGLQTPVREKQWRP